MDGYNFFTAPRDVDPVGSNSSSQEVPAMENFMASLGSQSTSSNSSEYGSASNHSIKPSLLHESLSLDMSHLQVHQPSGPNSLSPYSATSTALSVDTLSPNAPFHRRRPSFGEQPYDHISRDLRRSVSADGRRKRMRSGDDPSAGLGDSDAFPLPVTQASTPGDGRSPVPSTGGCDDDADADLNGDEDPEDGALGMDIDQDDGNGNLKTGGKMQRSPPSKNSANFVQKLSSLVNDPQYDQYIRWNADGISFSIPDQEAFTKEVLCAHFKTKHFTSFIRQLNNYDFHKMNRTARTAKNGSEIQVLEFQHQHQSFQRGRPELLKGIRRKASEPSGIAIKVPTTSLSAGPSSAVGTPNPSLSPAAATGVEATISALQQQLQAHQRSHENLSQEHQVTVQRLENEQRRTSQALKLIAGIYRLMESDPVYSEKLRVLTAASAQASATSLGQVGYQSGSSGVGNVGTSVTPQVLTSGVDTQYTPTMVVHPPSQDTSSLSTDTQYPLPLDMSAVSLDPSRLSSPSRLRSPSSPGRGSRHHRHTRSHDQRDHSPRPQTSHQHTLSVPSASDMGFSSPVSDPPSPVVPSLNSFNYGNFGNSSQGFDTPMFQTSLGLGPLRSDTDEQEAKRLRRDTMSSTASFNISSSFPTPNQQSQSGGLFQNQAQTMTGYDNPTRHMSWPVEHVPQHTQDALYSVTGTNSFGQLGDSSSFTSGGFHGMNSGYDMGGTGKQTL